MINALRTAEQKKALQEVIHEEVQEAPKEVKYGPAKMCPKCGKVKAYHFHVRSCKG